MGTVVYALSPIVAAFGLVYAVDVWVRREQRNRVDDARRAHRRLMRELEGHR